VSFNAGFQGKLAESAACDYLQAQGLTLVERNYRCRGGEIDLIMKDGDSMVFIEVRYRASSRFGDGAESVDRNKQKRLIGTAAHYLQSHPQAANRPARFDVVFFDASSAIHWIKDAFRA